MMALIERMALSSDVDLTKLERVLSYNERIYKDKARAAFDAAYSGLQVALPVLSENGEIRDKHGELQHTYPLWEGINEVIKPILSEHGFALWFRTSCDGKTITVTGVLSHLGGHAEETTLTLPADLSGGKNAVQAIGSSTSYGKRYTAAALLNLTSSGEDDDGSGSAAQPLINGEQIATLLHALNETGGSEESLLAYLDIRTIDDLPASKFERTLEAIKLRGRS
jgi:hypothetical protein